MPREISDAEYAQWQQDKEIAALGREIWDDPALGPAAKELVKRKKPGVSIPDHDIRKEMADGFAKIRKEHDDEKTAAQQKKEDDYWKSERTRVQKQFGFTDDGMKELEKTMLEKNIGDYEAAAHYHAAKNPKSIEPAGYKDPYYGFAKSDTFKEIAADPEGWGRGEIIKAITGEQQRRDRNAF